jgi:membrane-bound serine protease (ClpP class)
MFLPVSGTLAATAIAAAGLTHILVLPEAVLGLLAVLANPWIAAILVAIGLIALVAEVKAGASGLGILVSFVSLGLFFLAGITMGLASWVEILIALLGLLAIAAEVFVLPGFGVAGIVGIGMLGAAILLSMLGPAPGAGDVAQALGALGAAAVVTLAVGYAWIRKLPTSKRFSGLLLQDRMHSSAGYISATARNELVGQGGVALTALRPAGVADVAGERLDVVTEGEFIVAGTPVVVTRSDGYRHVVRSATQPQPAGDP